VTGYGISIGPYNEVLLPEFIISNEYSLAADSPYEIFKYYCLYALNRSLNIASLFMLAGPTIVKTEVAKQLPFDPHCETEEDIDWILRFFLSSYRMKLEKVPFFLSRKHPEQYSLTIKPEMVAIFKDRIAKMLEKIGASPIYHQENRL